MPASKKPTLRKLAVYLGGAIFFLIARPQPVLFACGASLAIAGEALRVWACGHLRKNKAVVKSGPYSHVKNPLYLGTFLILVGIVLASSDPAPGSTNRLLMTVFAPFVLGVFFFYYLPHKFRVEGGRLRRKFGDEWSNYDRAVPGFVPSPWPRISVEGRWSATTFWQNHEIGWVIFIPVALAIIASRFFFHFPW
jgi:protein-S-isoprenylcysteine O-methyltransferase Ste14